MGAASEVTSAGRVKRNFARDWTKVADSAKWSGAVSRTEFSNIDGGWGEGARSTDN